MAVIDQLFNAMFSLGGSDLHLSEKEPPKIRHHGRLRKLTHPPLTGDMMREYLEEICSPDRWQEYLATGDLDFAYSMGEEARFRANYFFQEHGMAAVFRIIPVKIKTLEQLQMPPVLKKFCRLRSGLVLVTGPTGSGKSTTLAAIIHEINMNSARHILTLEEPIEFVHPNIRSIICQREVGVDVPSFAEGLKIATRQDCDIILVGEMRDRESIALAISAAAMGTLVFGTLHTNSAVKTIDRIINVFEADEQQQIRTMLADSLQGICAQLLLKTADLKGRVACNEILLRSSALPACIREGNISNIRTIIQGGRTQGMQSMDASIQQRLGAQLISGEEAYMKAHDKNLFSQYAPQW